MSEQFRYNYISDILLSILLDTPVFFWFFSKLFFCYISLQNTHIHLTISFLSPNFFFLNCKIKVHLIKKNNNNILTLRCAGQHHFHIPFLENVLEIHTNVLRGICAMPSDPWLFLKLYNPDRNTDLRGRGSFSMPVDLRHSAARDTPFWL